VAEQMRITIVDQYYAAFVTSVYRARPGLADASSALQREALQRPFFGTADFYSHALQALGHEAQEVLPDCEALQRRWASEAGISVSRRWSAARTAILDAQIEALDPDVVYVQNIATIPRRQLDRWRLQRRLVAGQIAVALPKDRLVRGYGLIVSSFPHFPPRIQALGVDAAYLPLAFEPRVLDRLGAGTPIHDAVFVGGIDPKVHPAGTRMLEGLADRLDLQVWGYGGDRLAADSPLRRRWHGEAWGMDMYRALASGRIVLNRHIEAAEGHANNMRLFEATGVGAAVVTERADNLADLFAPGEEVVTYDGPQDLERVVAALLADEPRRAAVAAAGRARTLRDHTYPTRMAQLAELLGSRLLR
jgi:hypothetical protein